MSQLWLNTSVVAELSVTEAIDLTTAAGEDAPVGRDESGNVSVGGGAGGDAVLGENVSVLVIKTFLMGSIIVVSVMGNVLVIVSIGLHRKLQVLTNYFLVSLAMADMLVASCAMTFNASVEISGRWLFGYIMCDLWNSFDVYFSTVSILHLCCISVDRYYAIVKPLEYPLYMTKGTVVFMLANVWLAPTLISFIPIFLGWYATDDHLQLRALQPETCTFEVNKVYAILSSAFSFWIPCTVMVVLYSRILREARKQEAAILSRTNSTCTINNVQRHSPSSTAQQILAAFRSSNGPKLRRNKAKQKCQQDFQLGPLPRISRSDLSNDQGSVSVCGSGRIYNQNQCTNSRKVNKNFVNDTGQLGLPVTQEHSSSLEVSPRTISPDLSYNEESDDRVDMSPSSRPQLSRSSSISINGHTGSGLPVRVISPVPFGRRTSMIPSGFGLGGGGSTSSSSHPVLRREHKAARTLGIIMGAFILCWLPFFTWYVAVTICGDSCPCPQAVVTMLFWIGYFNSTLNPFIYAYFRTDFRDAFKKTLRQLKCCNRDDDYLGSFV
ncbi:Octopamine receptor beta-3R-like [Homarus americanus]|uniref:Octopamine receptor beta-3R-like n=2 Tax=Homarus americanus TaxID=6706 RepID=A0A8J5MZ65_HOMAM|nr:Octopamine receptor beta-3R-like [Homarus americanus]